MPVDEVRDANRASRYDARHPLALVRVVETRARLDADGDVLAALDRLAHERGPLRRHEREHVVELARALAERHGQECVRAERVLDRDRVRARVAELGGEPAHNYSELFHVRVDDVYGRIELCVLCENLVEARSEGEREEAYVPDAQGDDRRTGCMQS